MSFWLGLETSSLLKKFFWRKVLDIYATSIDYDQKTEDSEFFFSNVKRVLIDPEATNKRAIHVYQKVGFTAT